MQRVERGAYADGEPEGALAPCLDRLGIEMTGEGTRIKGIPGVGPGLTTGY